MVNLRFHIVSLVAVFLALAIGVIAGSTVIDQGVVNVLENQTDALREARDAARGEADLLRRAIATWESFGETLAPALLGDALAGREVVVITTTDAPPDLIGGVEDALVQAGGTVSGRVSLTTKWTLEDPSAAEQLGLIIGSRTAPPDLLSEAAGALALRLRVPRDPSAEEDLLRRLRENDFLTTTVEGRSFPSRDSLFVVIAPVDDDSLPIDTFALPLVRALADEGARVAAAAPLAAGGALVDRIRSDGSLRNVIATVDHADTFPGRIALVSALASVAAGEQARHYGERADEVAPPLDRRI
jgi:hypothetical protein